MTDLSDIPAYRGRIGNDLEGRVRRLEVDAAGSAERDKFILHSLDKIEKGIGRVIWIIVTAIIGGGMAFIMNGGLQLAH